ncbi:MAG: hypothetical protein Q8859_14240, partial [Bacteroidota bacterium]|nr:hypothetical protein [Bacteroidota bacterium]
MRIRIRRYIILTGILLLICSQWSYAGPPFLTDDPEPVDFRHWEYYISSINNIQHGKSTGTCPHFEINYGLIHNVQVHLLLPMNYAYNKNNGTDFGYAYTELGVKYRFVQESENKPQIGTFPIIEIPTIQNKEFGNGKAQVYLPLWIQKSWGKLMTYGGIGYWFNPGTNNKNWTFSGWEIQYDFSPVFTLGGELYHHSASSSDDTAATAFNMGGFINFSKKFHFIFSAGHSLTGNSYVSSYVGVL